MHNPFQAGWYCSEELREFGFAYVGENVRVSKSCEIVGLDNIEIWDHARIDAFTGIFATAGKVRIGRYSHIGGGGHLSAAADLTFEDYSGTSQGVKIYTGNDDYTGGALAGPCIPREYRDMRVAPVHVGRMAILGAGAVVLPGVSIGEGATVAANCVVRKSLDAWGTYAGNPLRRFGTRNERAADLAAEIDAMRMVRAA